MLRNSRVRFILIVVATTMLLLSFLLSTFFGGPTQSEDVYRNTVETKLARELNQVQKELVNVIQSIEQSKQIDPSVFPTDVAYPFYIFERGRLVFWSDYRYVPEYRHLSGDYRVKFVRTIRKDFMARKWSIADTDYEIFALIPLYHKYKVDNNYVQSGFNPTLFADQQLVINTLDDQEGTSICDQSGDTCYFKVVFNTDYRQSRGVLNFTIIASLSLAFIALGLLSYSFALKYGRKSVETGFLTLMIILIGIRLVMLELDFPQAWIQSSLFDSRFFASSGINPSMGDLLLNLTVVLILSIFLFTHYTKLNITIYLLTLTGWMRGVIFTTLSGLLILLLHVEFLIFQTIYHNSQLSFDINESITFDLNRTAGFVSFILLAVSIFLTHHVLFKLCSKRNVSQRSFTLFYGLGLVLFSGINWLIGQPFLEVVLVSAAWIVLLRWTQLPDYLAKIRYNTFLYFFSGIIAMALLASLAIFRFEHEREFERKGKYATQFLIENDNLAEFLLSEVNEKLRNDVFIQSRMASPFLSKDIIRSKIRQVYLSNYFDKYDVKIYLYSSNGQPFEGKPDALDPEEIQEFNADEYKTHYEGIYYINKLGAEVTKRYLDFVEVKKRGVSVGYVILDLTLKRIIPENVYPELLVDNAFLFPYQDANYSYAVFSGSEILYNAGNFNYSTNFDQTVLNEPTIYEDGINDGGFSHLAVRDPDGRVVVISSDLHPWLDIISNFSFLFLLQVFAVLILMGLYSLYFIFQKVSLNYSARIQLYLNIAFFLPLFAVSITTLSLINSSFKEEVNEEYYRKARSISSNISDDLDGFVSNVLSDRDELPQRLAQVAKFSGVDVNLFNTRGRLIATSQPLIYENNLLSQYINPDALINIKDKGENVFIARESVGQLGFNTTYYGVKSFGTGELIGIVSIPYFQSEFALEQNQIEVLSNVINIFSIIFIVFLLISYLAAKWLTFPLTFITQKLKKTTLTGFNEPLVWKSDDEIGLMVGEYNRMLVNLEESKKALARSEKETAWREIAQQVAHEIKNPLTPMKLTLQHMSRKLVDRADGKELERPIQTLLHEIETLNDIASSFSSFAKLPIPENERYAFLPVLKKSVHLHEATDGLKIDLQLPDEEVYTIGDDQLMSRIISNIIINASQSVDRDVEVKVNLQVTDTRRILLEISDNGSGIEESIQGKVFLPNFTTKETGSGIGLAVAKHGIEHAGGKIWFETERGKGTSFYIELPMVE